jgi:DNA topoisomerase-3
MKLYICEKPSQARDLARNLGVSGKGDGFIGDNYIAVTWAIGHLVQQLDPDEIDAKYSNWNIEHLPIVPEIWKMKPNAKTKKQLNIIKGLLQKFNHVVIATDGDREGEVIGRELLDYFEWTGNIDRLWLTALDDNSIHKALNNLKQGSETKPLYAAGLARARADWLVGMSATRALSLMAQKKDIVEYYQLVECKHQHLQLLLIVILRLRILSLKIIMTSLLFSLVLLLNGYLQEMQTLMWL